MAATTHYMSVTNQLTITMTHERLRTILFPIMCTFFMCDLEFIK